MTISISLLASTNLQPSSCVTTTVLAAKLLFSNPSKIDPYFEVEARTDVKDYRVTVALSGTMSRIVLRSPRNVDRLGSSNSAK